MTPLPDGFLRAFETAAPGASPEALGVFIWLAARGDGAPASLAKGLEIAQAAVLRAFGELQQADLVNLSPPAGRAGRRRAQLSQAGLRLKGLIPAPPEACADH